jgi:hypothetical protein
MEKIKILVGTRKGGFIITSKKDRRDWKIEGPFFSGWEIYHINGSPVNPDRIYASQSSGWFGQVIQRSDDGGRSWNPVGNNFVYEGELGTHQWFDGTQKPWQFKRIWQIQPSLTEPETVFAGAEDAALFKSADGGLNWSELASLRKIKGELWQPGAGGMGCCRRLPDGRRWADLEGDQSGIEFRH